MCYCRSLREAPVYQVSEEDMARLTMMDIYEYFSRKTPVAIPLFIVRPPQSFIQNCILEENYFIFDESEKPKSVRYKLKDCGGVYKVDPLKSKALGSKWLCDHLDMMKKEPCQNSLKTSVELLHQYCSRTAALGRCNKIKSYPQDLNVSVMKKLYEIDPTLPSGWNMYLLPNILHQVYQGCDPVLGITRPMMYASEEHTGSRLHVEDFEFASVSFLYPNSSPKVSFLTY